MSRLFTILRWTIAVVFALTVYSASAQSFDTVTVQQFSFSWLVAAFVLLAGCFEGVMDHLQFHYDKNDQFWSPGRSWKNKYKGGDPANGMTFRGKYLVFTTDGWHLMKFGRNLFIMAALTVGSLPASWLVLTLLTYWAINRIGFNLTYKWIRL